MLTLCVQTSFTSPLLLCAGVIHFHWTVPGSSNVYMLDKVEAVLISKSHKVHVWLQFIKAYYKL